MDMERFALNGIKDTPKDEKRTTGIWRNRNTYISLQHRDGRAAVTVGLTLTTMLVVGDAIDNRRGLSELYNAQFTHLFRKGREGEV